LLPLLAGSIPDLIVSLQVRSISFYVHTHCQVLNVLVHPSLQFGTKAYCFNYDGVAPNPRETNEILYSEIIKAVNVCLCIPFAFPFAFPFAHS
jgi:hypothetical protein